MKAAGRLLLGLAAVLAPAVLEAQEIPLAPEFQANTYTTGRQGHPGVASAGDGSFVVVWARGPGNPGIFARRYDDQGTPMGSEFQVNSGTAVPGQYPSVAASASGGFVVVWDDADGYNSHGRRFDDTGAPVGSQLALARIQPKVASDAAGNFVVVGSELHPGVPFIPPYRANLLAQRFDAVGAPAGSEFVVSGFTDNFDGEYDILDYAADRAVAMSPGGDFTVVWAVAERSLPIGARPSFFTTGDLGVFGKRFSKTGASLGPVFAVTTSSATRPREPAVALDPFGNFVVVWSSDAQDGAGRGIRGQRLDSSGGKVGPEFQVNTYTTDDQNSPSVAIDDAGDFVVVWNSAGQDGSSSGVFGARFDRHGTPLGGEFPINVFTAGAQEAPQIVDDGRGFVAAWESADEDGNGFGVFARRQNLLGEKLAVDEAAATGGTSDRDGVLEPGETVFVAPSWRNVGGVSLPLTGGGAFPPCPPAAACVSALDGAADYGTVAAGALGICNDASADACYRVSASGPRPGTHWDAAFTENLSTGGGRIWPIHVGDSFSDVPRSQPFYKKIETLLHTGVTSGCTATQYCPGAVVSRDQMAIFVAKGIAGAGELVPSSGLVGTAAYACVSGGTSLFTDVAPTDSFCKHVHYMAAQNVTLGCTATQYCPGQAVTRDAMASFIAKAVVAPGGGAAVPITYSDSVTGLSYSCAAASPNIHFTDVPASSTFCKHIHYLWSRGIVSGCTATTYCPSQTVTRDAMAKFIANGFGLQLYGPSVKPSLTASNAPPTVAAGPDQAVTQTGASTAVALAGSASDDGLPNPPGNLTHHWTQVSGPTVTFNDATALSTTAHFPQAALYVLRLTASDGLLSSSDDVSININPTGGVPSDPGTVAPPLDPGVATDVATSTAFLYTGPDPIQTGVADGTIDPRRAAVVRGRVLTRDGAPLSGVKVTILQHSELGQTLSRGDGMFDMAVNGGGMLTFRYEKTGVLPAQRQVVVPWGDFAFVPDVSLVPADSQVTLIDLTSPAPFQVARATPVSDADGTRRATVLFPAGTTAGLVQPNGSTVPTTHLHVRLTEYTVGPSGPSAMPGELPPTSSYTYATELGADEAVAKVNGRDVVFNHPVLLYVENLTHIPVGQSVPAGYYDPARSTWIGAPDGRVIKVLSVTAGKADLDVNGDGTADTGAALTALGITDAERQQVATLYAAGTSLWRTPIDHFSTIDTNFPAVCEGACAPPNEPPPPPPNSCQNSAAGSIIGCDRQTLGEDIPIPGTPFSLHYESDRVPGRTAEQRLLLGLSTKGLPQGVQGTQLEVLVAGQKLAQDFPSDAASATVSWDGDDAYGRAVVGSTRVTVRVGYTYKLVPATPAVAAISWARFSGIPMSGGFARGSVTLWQESTGTITRWDSRGLGLGGWTLSALHAYDPVGRVIHFGDGTRRDASSLSAGAIPAGSISTFAGKTPGGFAGDGGPASDARFRYPYGLAVASDGSLYIADSQNHRVRRVDPNGVITTVAGNGTQGFAGDNGPATSAELNTPLGVALGPDGSLFIVDQLNYRIRRVRPDQTIVTLAGNGASVFGGDGGPAPSAGMQPWGVAVGPDGAVYIADRSNSTIRMVDQNGMISRVAGNGLSLPNGNGVPATSVNLGVPSDVAVGPDGSLYIIVGGPGRVRKVTPQGIISTLAGTTAGYGGDGGPAKTAQIDSPIRLAVGPDGSIYIPDSGNQRLRWIGSEGIIATVAGNGLAGFSGDGGLATQAQFSDPVAVAIGPDGAIYVADSFNQRIRKIVSALPGVSASDILIPFPDGSELYVFSGAGRHKKTLDALTGAVRAQFTYDSQNRIVSVDDGDGNVTTIERDGTTGDPTGLLAPFGQETKLTLDAHGFLASIKDPVNDQFSLTSTAGGLLTQLTDPRGGLHKFTYDAVGRLTKDQDPAGGSTTLARAETTTGVTVTSTTKLGRTTTCLSERLASGALHFVRTEPGGVVTDTVLNTDGSMKTTEPDGTVETTVPGPDPRWGMLAPIAASYTRTTPAALAEAASTTRTVTLSDPNDPLSLLTQTTKSTFSGNTWTTTYQSASSTLTRTSPAARMLTRTLDARGRIVSQQVPGLATETYSFDAKGRLSSVVVGTGGGARTTSYTYNAGGFLATKTDPAGRVTIYTYDAAGRITSETLPGSLDLAAAYDAAGNPTSITPPLGSAHAFTYSPIDLTASYAPPALPGGPTPTTYTYDADRNLTRTTRPDSVLVDYGYDTAGRLNSVSLPAGSLGFAYDASGRLTTASPPNGPSLAFTYDGDLPTGESSSGSVAGSVGRGYDTSFRLSSVKVNGTNSIAFGYDGDDLLTSAGALSITNSAQTGLRTGTSLGVVSDAWTYSTFGDPATYTASANGTAQLTQTYTRDKLGRTTTLAETIGGVAATYDYTYDATGRLTEVDKNGSAIENYTYDDNGNRLSFTGSGGPQLASYDVQDRLTNYRGNTYAYSKGGELESRGAGAVVTTFAYDPLGSLLGVTLTDGTAIAYLVDGLERRVGKKVNGLLVQGFLYEGDDRPAAELNGSGTVVSRFVYDTTHDNVPAYMIKAGTTYRIVTDPIGSVRLVINTATGAIAQRLDYDGFGQVTNDTSPGFQPFGFAGGLYDKDTKLVRFGARDYDPETGRWTAKDPIGFSGGQTNLYAYVDSDPINRIDSEGLAAPPRRGGGKGKIIEIKPPCCKEPAPKKQESQPTQTYKTVDKPLGPEDRPKDQKPLQPHDPDKMLKDAAKHEQEGRDGLTGK